MRRLPLAVIVAALVVVPLAAAHAFAFHCRGNACRVVAFADEGNGCTVATNYGRYPVAVTQGVDQSYVLNPGETMALLLGIRCYGYYNGGETANYLTQTR